MAQSTVSAGLAAGLIDYAAILGADAASLKQRSGLNRINLNDPDGRVPFLRYVELMRQAQIQSKDPAFALHWGENVDMSDVSILGLIMNAATTMGEAFVQLQRYGRLAMAVDGAADGPSFELVVRAGQLFMVHHTVNNGFPELVENAFVRLTCGPRQFLDKPHILSVHFAHPAPDHQPEYERIFQCPVHFNTEWNAMELHPEVASWEVAQSPHYISTLLAERADA